MNPNYLDFEQPIAELQAKIEELRLVGNDSQLNLNDEIGRLEEKSRKLTESIFKDLSPWQVSQLSRHPQRPYTLDYLEHIFTDFDELHGDRRFADDPPADRRGGEMVDRHPGADGALARLQEGPQRVERGVLHDHHHDRRGQHRRQQRVLEDAGQMPRLHRQLEAPRGADLDPAHPVPPAWMATSYRIGGGRAREHSTYESRFLASMGIALGAGLRPAARAHGGKP